MNNKKNLGMSMVEIVIATSITSIIVMIAVNFMITSSRFQSMVVDQSAAASTAERSLKYTTAILREANDGDNGDYAFITVDPYNISFYSDVDKDEYSELVEIYLEGTTLYSKITEPTTPPVKYLPANSKTKVLATNVVNTTVYSNPVFTYYNGDYPADTVNNPLAEPIDLSAISLVQIHLDINVHPNQLPDTTTVETFIQVRNLKTNL